MATTRKAKTKAEIEKELRDLRREFKKLQEEKESLADSNSVQYIAPIVEQKTIDWGNRMVEIMQVMPGETTLYYGSGENRMEVGRLNGSGATITLSFPELQRVTNTPPFNKYFNELGIIILDEEVIKKLNQTTLYSKYDMGVDWINKIFDLSLTALEKKLKSLPETLQYAVVYQCMVNINNGDPRCTKPPVHDVFNKVFKMSRGSDIYTLAQRLKATS